MTTLRTIATSNRNASLRQLASRYHVLTARQLIASYDSKTEYAYGDYVVKRSGSTITIKSQGGESTNINFGNAKATPEQQDEFIEKTWEGTKRFFQEHADDILSGKMKAADIGGAVFGIAGTVITLVFSPFGAAGKTLDKIIGLPFGGLSAQKGRYWGASIDELVSLLKGESDLKMQAIVGVLATVVVTCTYLSLVEELVPLGGVDAWNLTVEVGKKIGGVAASMIEAIVSVVGVVGKVASNVIDDLTKLIGI